MVEVDQDNKLAEALLLRESYRHKTFLMMFEVLVIFGAPAVAAYFLGKYMELSKAMHFGILGTAFVISWAIMIARYKSISRKLKEVNSVIKKEQGKDV